MMETALVHHAVIDHGSWTEHHLATVDDSAEALSSLTEALAADGLTPVRFDRFASRRDGDGPLRLLPLGQGGIGGTLVLAVRGLPLRPVRVAGRCVGFTGEDEHLRWCWLDRLLPADAALSEAEQTVQVYDLMDRALADAGLAFTDVVRTWFYNRRILDWYGGFNRVRTARFRAAGVFDRLVPASTGIGLENSAGTALLADVLAVQARSDEARIEAVASPLQCPAPAYGSSFSRAVAITTPQGLHLSISGTASIAPGGESLHHGDAAAQVDLTLDVVGAILASRGLDWGDTVRAIAYWRRAEDAHLLDERCRARGIPSLPAVPVEATVCRDDLLFELELDAWRAW